MADKSHIEWTDATWNPITGCSVVSPGCTNCYAMKLAGTRLKHIPSRAGLTIDTKAGPVWNGQVRFNEQWLDQPLKWKTPRMIFVCAHGDLFHESVSDEWIDKVFAVMALAPQHTFQVLTKRAERMRAYLSEPGVVRRIYELVCDITIEQQLFVALIAPGMDETVAPAAPRIYLDRWPIPNVWLGVSAEDQKRADERIPELLATPAAIRFVSAEPLLGLIDLLPYLFIVTHEDDATLACPAGHDEPLPFHDPATTPLEDIATPRLDWIIGGGESGRGARPMHPAWVRGIRDQCADADVPFFFKQWGAWLAGQWEDAGDQGRLLPADGRTETLPFRRRERREHWFEPKAWPEGPGAVLVGKKAAGRKLDGIEHNDMPAIREVPFQ